MDRGWTSAHLTKSGQKTIMPPLMALARAIHFGTLDEADRQTPIGELARRLAD